MYMEFVYGVHIWNSYMEFILSCVHWSMEQSSWTSGSDEPYDKWMDHMDEMKLLL